MRPLSVTVVAVCAALHSGCEGRYTLEPTACDDWCFAQQRLDCEDDSPEGCVSLCERTDLLDRRPECQEQWQELLRCYRQAPDDRFSCVDERSQPAYDLCVEERRALAECAAPAGALCVDDCLRTASTCGSNPTGCERGCLELGNVCTRETRALFECSLTNEVVCTEQSVTHHPCLPEWLMLCECLPDIDPADCLPDD